MQMERSIQGNQRLARAAAGTQSERVQNSTADTAVQLQGPPPEELSELRHPQRRSPELTTDREDEGNTPSSSGFSLGKLAGACGILLGTAAAAAIGYEFFKSGIVGDVFGYIKHNPFEVGFSALVIGASALRASLIADIASLHLRKGRGAE